MRELARRVALGLVVLSAGACAAGRIDFDAQASRFEAEAETRGRVLEQEGFAWLDAGRVVGVYQCHHPAGEGTVEGVTRAGGTLALAWVAPVAGALEVLGAALARMFDRPVRQPQACHGPSWAPWDGRPGAGAPPRPDPPPAPAGGEAPGP